MDIVKRLRKTADAYSPFPPPSDWLHEAADEIEKMREALDGFEGTMSDATETIKTLLNDLKIQNELRARLETICEKQHNILIANGIFPQENTKQ